MKITIKNQAKLSEKIEAAIQELDHSEELMKGLIEAYANNQKVKDQLQNLVQNMKILSTEEIEEQIKTISQQPVVMRENSAPYITSGDICAEYEITDTFKSITHPYKE